MIFSQGAPHYFLLFLLLFSFQLHSPITYYSVSPCPQAYACHTRHQFWKVGCLVLLFGVSPGVMITEISSIPVSATHPRHMNRYTPWGHSESRITLVCHVISGWSMHH